MTWKEYIRQLRAQLGVSQAELADLLGITNKTVQNWEYRGSTPIPMYQDILVNIGENIEAVKVIVAQRRQERQRLMFEAKRNVPEPSLGKTVATIGAGAGIAYGLFKLLGAIFDGQEKKE